MVRLPHHLAPWRERCGLHAACADASAARIPDTADVTLRRRTDRWGGGRRLPLRAARIVPGKLLRNRKCRKECYRHGRCGHRLFHLRSSCCTRKREKRSKIKLRADSQQAAAENLNRVLP